ncbi:MULTISPECIES: dephospho-CoA kinase [Acinetobacter]|jgi:dephospho-CoA kinase (EC 2.7.1.24)|uniref:Dephospho-CoA kinase n=1 Tax=Acinetobacter baumannii TaxID=470 RepID=A0A077GUL8_ACIBA|nr:MULTISPECIES: dephospho-CoA kinase [Acinetobacter]ABO10790.2 dephosphocoenzyme A kinase [Acinetobacter baumannii ATCC 17978]AIL80094.1 dephospho-CoA kinase [Acinetobacter baumannii]AIS05119.1 dephospho-CoA kinase [Acinetobacter baumannii]AKQ28279.1 dephospho-CoA kinase [Acinetobacter baumannii]ANA36535.1 dephospho-CoA kinase [Acinetobacter baumannii]
MAFILGITGGIGSGKSAATQWFESQGIQVVDADIVAREVVEKGQPALQKIQQTFGDWVLQPDGSLDRRALREYIFQNPQARHTLEQITHPAIRQSIIQQLQNRKSPYVILVSPLLFETNQHELVNHTLLIDASEQTQIQRASQRDGQNQEQIQKIIAAQMPRERKRELANDIVFNDGLLEHLYQQLEPLHQSYLKRAN